MMAGSKKTKLATRIILNIAAWIGAVIILLPLANILILSVSDQKAYNENPMSFLTNFKFSNYMEAWEKARILQYGLNTIFVIVVALLGVIAAASLCAYGISRFSKYREVGLVYYLVISGMFIPVQAIILPLFKELKSLGLLNNLLGLSIIYMGTTLSLSMMLFAGYYRSLPRELEEAATLDGCSPMRAFWKIIFPLSTTIVATVAILAGLTIWRDFFIPLVVITTPENKTLGVGLLAFVDEFSLDWTPMCAAMVMQTIPILILYLALQKYFVSGVVSGAVKG